MLKKSLLIGCAVSFALAGTDDASMDLLLQKLIEKNIISGEEAGELAGEMKKAVGERNKDLSSDIAKKVSSVKIDSKAVKLEFSGTHYIGYTMAKPTVKNANLDNSAGFELRRNYLQVKGYFNDKDYFRVTMDTTKELGADESKRSGYANMFVKYAYLYLDKVLPYTGVEMGIVHRPWIDYEEHNAWHYRSFNKVALEHKNTTTEYGPDLVNSADFGFNLQTKTPYLSSELGLFNGEGYHADKLAANQKNSSELSMEGRVTAHIFGTGEKVGKLDRTKDSYANISLYGLSSKNHKDNNITIDDSGEFDRAFAGIHAVYNHPMFLLAGQVFKSKDDYTNDKSNKEVNIDGWSINTEIRPIKDWTIIGRYDKHKKETEQTGKATAVNEDAKQIIYGLAYKYNKNITFIATGKHIDEKIGGDINDKKVYMLTSEVKW